MTKNRFLRRAHGDDQVATTAGLAVFLREVQKEGDGVIVVPTLKNFSASMVTTALGEPLAKQFYKDRTLPVGSSTISLCSDATLKNFRHAKVYLALWSSNYLIDEIEGLDNWCSLVWVTWLPNEADQWAAKHNPVLF